MSSKFFHTAVGIRMVQGMLLLPAAVLPAVSCAAFGFTDPAVLNSDAATDFELAADNNPRVATDNAGNWVAVWDSCGRVEGMGVDLDIHVSHSSDNGRTWAPVGLLNTNGPTDSAADEFPCIATDGKGTWVSAWQSGSKPEEYEGTGYSSRDILVAWSTNNGESWSEPFRLSHHPRPDQNAQDTDAQIATDGKGNWVIVWESTSTLGRKIGSDADILFCRSSDNAQTWTPPAALNSDAATDSKYDSRPVVATDNGGRWIAAWNSPEMTSKGTDSRIVVAHSTDGGATWTKPASASGSVLNPAESRGAPHLATDGAGNWMVAWNSLVQMSKSTCDYDVFLTRSSDNGLNWTAPQILTDNKTIKRNGPPRLASNRRGDWIIVWGSNDSFGRNSGDDEDIVASRSTDAGATWTPPVQLNGNAFTDNARDGGPDIGADSAGNWVVVWNSNDSLGNTLGLDSDLRVARTNDLSPAPAPNAPSGS